MDKELESKLDKIIALLKTIAKPDPLWTRIANGVATGVGILGILGAIEIVLTWLGG
jgi:hypothetical protein